MKGICVPFFIAHQGCPERCVFCDQKRIAGAAGVLPTGKEMLEKIAAYRAGAKGRSTEVAFFGGSFTALPLAQQEGLLAPLQDLIASGCVTGVRVSTRPEAVDRGTVAYLKERGVRVVELGVQSLNDEVLRLSGRGHSAADTRAAAGAVREGGLQLGLQLMPGLPGDDRARSLATMKGALELQPDFLRIYPTVVLAGTELAARYREGSYRPLELDEAVSLCKEMLLLARGCCVPVIRMGLQPGPDLEGGAVLAGPYHPAFGQLVQGEVYYDLLCRLAAHLPRGSSVTLSCAPGRLSDLVGHRRGNLKRLEKRFGLSVQGVREDREMAPDSVALARERGVGSDRSDS